MAIQKLFWWAYLVVLHIVVLFVIAAIPEVRNRFQMEKRLPGSRLSTQYDNRPDEWMRFIMHDGRPSPVVSIIDRPFGVEHIAVAPPGSRYVWNFDRDEGEEWKLFVAEYDTARQAAAHNQGDWSKHVMVDGYPGGGLDGYPDREVFIEGDTKRIYTIEPKQSGFLYEAPYNPEP